MLGLTGVRDAFDNADALTKKTWETHDLNLFRRGLEVL